MDSIVAIVLPGPSAPDLWDNDSRYSHVIAVNAAIRLVKNRPAWWCFSRPERFVDHAAEAPAELRIVTYFEVLAALLAELPAERVRALVNTPAYTVDQLLPVNWRQSPRSALVALALAYRLGANVIRLFGAEFRGDADFTGRICNRKTSRRWVIEERQCRDLVGVIESRMVPVEILRLKYDTAFPELHWQVLLGDPTRPPKAVADARAMFVRGERVRVG